MISEELKPGWFQRQFDELKPFLCMRCGQTFNDTHTCRKPVPAPPSSATKTIVPEFCPHGIKIDSGLACMACEAGEEAGEVERLEAAKKDWSDLWSKEVGEPTQGELAAFDYGWQAARASRK